MDDYIAERLTKSTAVRKSVRVIDQKPWCVTEGPSAVFQVSDLPPLKTPMTAEEYAGMHVEMLTTYDVMKDGSIIRTDHQSVAEAIAKVSRGRGRPRTITDMKAYKAQKERERRQRLKTEREGK